MKTKTEDLRNLGREELISKISSCKEELGKMNYLRVVGQVEKPHKFKLLKREIARIETLLNESQKKGK